jgi:hypothetical protein
VIRRPIDLNKPLDKQVIPAGLPAGLASGSGIIVGAEIFYSFYDSAGKLVEVVNPVEIAFGSDITIVDQPDVVSGNVTPSSSTIIRLQLDDTKAGFNIGLSATTIASYISSGVVASNTNIARIKAAIVAGNYGFADPDLDGNYNILVVNTSGLDETPTQSYKLDSRLFTNFTDSATGLAIVTGDLGAAAYASIANAGIDKGVVATASDNFITITLNGNEAVFAGQSALTSGTVKLKSFTVTGGSASDTSGVTNASGMNFYSGLFKTNASPFVRVSDTELRFFVSDSLNSLTSGLLDGTYTFTITSGALIQTAAGFASGDITITSDQLGYVPADGVSYQRSLSEDLLITDADLFIFVQTPSDRLTFNKDVSMSDLIFSGVHASVFAAADVLVEDTGKTLRVTGFKFLNPTDKELIEVWVKPSAFVRADTSAEVVFSTDRVVGAAPEISSTNVVTNTTTFTSNDVALIAADGANGSGVVVTFSGVTGRTYQLGTVTGGGVSADLTDIAITSAGVLTVPAAALEEVTPPIVISVNINEVGKLTRTVTITLTPDS